MILSERPFASEQSFWAKAAKEVGSHPYIWKKVNSGKWMAVSLLPLNNKHVHFQLVLGLA